MKDSIFHKLIKKIKTKKFGYPSVSEYAFSPEEIANLNEQNKQKIQDLKQDLNIKPKKKEKLELPQDIPSIRPEVSDEIVEPQLDSKEEIIEDSSEVKQQETIPEEKTEEIIEEQPKVEEKIQKNSFINLNEKHQKLVMTKWNSIDNTEIDKDIIEGKDLLNHNYTITYADSATKYIHTIRKKYELVLCYLIGFNNEKKGIYDKTIFSDKIDDEWRFLSNYIKLLEKIRNFKKQ